MRNQSAIFIHNYEDVVDVTYTHLCYSVEAVLRGNQGFLEYSFLASDIFSEDFQNVYFEGIQFNERDKRMKIYSKKALLGDEEPSVYFNDSNEHYYTYEMDIDITKLSAYNPSGIYGNVTMRANPLYNEMLDIYSSVFKVTPSQAGIDDRNGYFKVIK